jgi:peroxiredoxin family protein
MGLSFVDRTAAICVSRNLLASIAVSRGEATRVFFGSWAVANQ